MGIASDRLLELAWTQAWQLAVVAAVVAVVARLACRHRPHLAYLLWMLVIVKALAPPLWSSPTGAFSWAMLRTVPPATSAAPPAAEPRQPPLAPIVTRPQLAAEPAPPSGAAPLNAPLPDPSAPASSPFSPAAALLGLWAAGSLALAASVVLRWLALRRLVARTSQQVPPRVAEQFEALRLRIAPRWRARLVFTTAPFGPATFGWWRGTVVVPASLVHEKSPEALAPILAHELIHLRRHDTWAGLVQLAAQLVWWFHPAVWWANRSARIERERSCDEEVLAELACRRADYARLLVEVLKWRHTPTPALPWPGMRAWDVTRDRLRHVLDTTTFRRRTPVWAWPVFLLAISATLPGAAMRLAAAPTEDNAPRVGERPTAASTGDSFRDQEAAVAELERLGVAIKNGGYVSDGKLRRTIDVEIPAAYQPTDNPLPLAELDGLQNVQIGVQPPAGPQPSVERLREQIRAARDIPSEATLLIYFTDANAEGLNALEEIPSLSKLMLAGYRADSPLGELGVVALPAALHFERFKQLHTLTWLSPFETDLLRLADLPQLEHLGLMGRMIEPALEPLSKLANLKTLNLIHYDSSHEIATLDLKFLAGMPRLEELSASGTYTLSSDALQRIGAGRVRKLMADVSGGDDGSLRGLARNTNLKQLHLLAQVGGSRLTSEGLAALGAFANLEKLHFDGRTLPETSSLFVTDASLAGWQRLEKLKSLSVRPCRITGAGLSELGHLASLEKLQLTGTLEVAPEGLTPLGKLTRLQTLVLPSMSGGVDLGPLTRLQQLDALSLANSPINDAAMASIVQCEALTQLDLSDTPITDEGLLTFEGRLPALERVSVANTGVTDRGLAVFAGREKLRELNAAGTGLTAELLRRLLDERPQVRVWTANANAPQSSGGDDRGEFLPIRVE
ncbi:MAG: hypothetical protein DWQ37_04855 [Planctomycetota bacterium]|nr:MAG: hypothetical protein DWQ37_04855 [Planctomycetota bacterium]